MTRRNKIPLSIEELTNQITIKKTGSNSTIYWETYAYSLKQGTEDVSTYNVKFLRAQFLCTRFGNLELGISKFRRGLNSRLRNALVGNNRYDDLNK